MTQAKSPVSKPAQRQQKLARVLSRKDVWTGRRAATAGHAQTSCWPALDQLLLGRGWPRGELVEICQAGAESKASASRLNSLAGWHLLLPCLKSMQQQPGYVFLLNPPLVPYLPGLAQQGIDCSRLLVVSVERPDAWLASWCDILDSGSCAALLAWQPGDRLRYAQLRKLQLAASRGSGLSWLLRDKFSLQSSTPAALRIQVQSSADALQVRVEKQRGTYRQGQLQLPWPEYLQPDRLQVLQQARSTEPATGASVLEFPGRRG